METEERKIAKNSLTSVDWQNSQEYEAIFWQSQKVVGNQEQYHRNNYYKNPLEDGCLIAQNFFAKDFSDKIIIDVGSGPEGILHAIEAKKKIAIDSLMEHYRTVQQYEVDADDVICISSMAEMFELNEQADVALCLNALDHFQWPQAAIANIHLFLKDGGDFLLITDLRSEEQLDAYHKLPVTEENVLGWLDEFEIIYSHNFPHQADNPVRQLIVQCRKFTDDNSV